MVLIWLMWNPTDKTGYKNPEGRAFRSQARVKVKPDRNKVVITMTWLGLKMLECICMKLQVIWHLCCGWKSWRAQVSLVKWWRWGVQWEGKPFIETVQTWHDNMNHANCSPFLALFCSIFSYASTFLSFVQLLLAHLLSCSCSSFSVLFFQP